MENAGLFKKFSRGGLGMLDFLLRFAQNPTEFPMFPFGHHDRTKLQFLFSDDLKIFFGENRARAWLLDGLW
jgi:hypothetical protein